ncbi:uncharacterized protein LOC129569451 [Sitodiplosis mosellana]|uniref:uncharacterized protein LOC129569451 n=1 Tax=Sitodiplosis mosellana TaxID=263140 RepID=UPI0024445057|nr:uncharacterized protein LOC129569451 [Sitodiplosis mosellana]
MNLFVWNDRRWQLVNVNSDYDKENYLVIRKLFVRWLKNSEDTSRINASICKAFERFGKIDSVENVNGANAKAKPDVHEAYITFNRSEDAYKAFVDNRNDTKSSDELITLLPIDTWKVAPVQSKDDELTELSRRIEDVDEDEDPRFIYRMYITPAMLLKVFRAFLRISKSFLNGLDLNYELDESDDESDESDDELFDKETVKYDPESDASEQTDQTEESTSQEATENEDESSDSEETDPDAELDCLNNHEFEKRISEVIVKNLGPKFETLSIRKDHISWEMLQWFAPVLKQLNKLTIHIVSNCNILYAMPSYCANVQSFHLDGNEWDGEFEQMPAESWPSLKELYLNIITWNDEDKHKLQQFIELNPQIMSLQIESPIDLDLLATIGKKLVDLNTLAFVRSDFEGLNIVLDNLAGLTEMHGLKMSALKVEKNHLNGLIKCAKRLSRLQHLHLITIFLNCESDIDEDNDFKHLKEFCITHHYNCKCHGPNRVVSFRDNDIEVPEESAVLALIVNTKPPTDSIDKSMEMEILATFKKTTKFFPNIIEHIELADKTNHIYIQISSNR